MAGTSISAITILVMDMGITRTHAIRRFPGTPLLAAFCPSSTHSGARLTKPIRVLGGAMLLAAVFFSASDASAHTTRSRPVEATVESLNLENGTLTIAPAKGKGPSVLALTRQTKFIHNWKFAPASELKKAAHATVYYRTPFFGKPFVTKIVWINGA